MITLNTINKQSKNIIEIDVELRTLHEASVFLWKQMKNDSVRHFITCRFEDIENEIKEAEKFSKQIRFLTAYNDGNSIKSFFCDYFSHTYDFQFMSAAILVVTKKNDLFTLINKLKKII